jgi:pentose-5-phosphate-3-epimerase
MVRAIRSDIEISWDGGANSDTIGDIARAGIDVINVGSAIQLADNAESAYATLVAKVG